MSKKKRIWGGLLNSLPINKTKTMIFLIIGIMIGSSIGVYATSSLNSNFILYDNEITNSNNVKDALDELFEKSKPKDLSDVVSIGDYVAYDAGMWTETKARPTNQGNFGGYTAGQNKANSVNWCYQSSYITTLKGWRVFSVDANTKTVILVHAGHPECYYHESGQSAQSVINLNNRATSEYFNNNYAESAHMMNSTEVELNILQAIGDYYYTATAWDTWSLYHVNVSSTGIVGNNKSMGIRPVIVLKQGIKTTGKTIDAVGNEAWSLVAP